MSPIDRVKLLAQLRVTFVGEMQEYVEALNRDLMALEKSNNPGEVTQATERLLRTAHSLKGAARSIDLATIESACHNMEEVLESVQRARAAAAPALLKLLFSTVDAIEETGGRLSRNESLEDSPLSAMGPQLEAIANAMKIAGGAPGAAEAPNEAALPFQTAPSLAEPSASAEPAPESRGAAAVAVVRVPAHKLDALLGEWGELLAGERRLEDWTQRFGAMLEGVRERRAHLARMEKAAGQGSSEAQDEAQEDSLRALEVELEQLAGTLAVDGRARAQSIPRLNDHVRRFRMSPLLEVCGPLERAVRDLCVRSGKEVEFVVQGGDTELDRSILDRLKDPLLHLVRNAVDHGVETPQEREAAGKPPRATVTLSVSLRGSEVELVLKDDGRGINLAAIRARAQQRGIEVPLDEAEVARLIFAPGFSTAKMITEVSGRGVGLDVVRTEIESVHGRIDLSFVAGMSTCFTLIIPLTLTSMRALLVSVEDQQFAIATTNIRRLLEIDADRIQSVEGRQMIQLEKTLLPILALSSLLGVSTASPPPGAKLRVVVVAAGAAQMALVVDELISEQELVVKKLGVRVKRMNNLAGGAILPTGKVALILNAAALMRHRGEVRHKPTRTDHPSTQGRARLLLVDDSVTVRTQQKAMLESAGYEVFAAVNGAEGWQLLQERGADLVVSDVEMPRMDGFMLTAMIRAAPRFAKIPIILVTGLETEQAKARGLEVGANAYLLKSGYDQTNLLETIAHLL